MFVTKLSDTCHLFQSSSKHSFAKPSGLFYQQQISSLIMFIEIGQEMLVIGYVPDK